MLSRANTQIDVQGYYVPCALELAIDQIYDGDKNPKRVI